MKDEPFAYGMTVGELAALYNDERKIRAKIEVVPVLGWHRVLRYDPTSLPWLNPSPDIRNIRQAILYPGARRIPSEHTWAPFLDERALAGKCDRRSLPGISFP